MAFAVKHSARLSLFRPKTVALTARQASLDATDRSLAPPKGLSTLGFDRPVSRPSRQPATGPPGSYPDRTSTGRRRRAALDHDLHIDLQLLAHCRHRHNRHLRRDFKAHAEGLAAEKAFGEAGLRACEELFWSWEIFQHTRNRKQLRRRIRALRREFKPILCSYAGKQARYRHTRGMARNLLKLWPARWTFADHRGIEPTNNHAERALRGSVIYRKLSLGTQSNDGERRIERLLSVHTTCRLQHRPLHDYLVNALTAHSRGDPAPLLT